MMLVNFQTEFLKAMGVELWVSKNVKVLESPKKAPYLCLIQLSEWQSPAAQNLFNKIVAALNWTEGSFELRHQAEGLCLDDYRHILDFSGDLEKNDRVIKLPSLELIGRDQNEKKKAWQMLKPLMHPKD